MTKNVHKLNLLAFASQVTNDPTWYVDTRATQHVLWKWKKSSTIKHVRACNIIHQIARQGEVAIKLLHGKVRQIPNVLHVPSFF